MQSVRLDEWQITLQGDYWERPAALSFDALRAMVEQTPVLSAVVMTRVRQILRFARVAEGSTNEPGFEIRHIDRMHQLTDAEQESIRLLQRFLVIAPPPPCEHAPMRRIRSGRSSWHRAGR